jgi:hypothetical protein
MGIPVSRRRHAISERLWDVADSDCLETKLASSVQHPAESGSFKPNAQVSLMERIWLTGSQNGLDTLILLVHQFLVNSIEW